MRFKAMIAVVLAGTLFLPSAYAKGKGGGSTNNTQSAGARNVAINAALENNKLLMDVFNSFQFHKNQIGFEGLFRSRAENFDVILQGVRKDLEKTVKKT